MQATLQPAFVLHHRPYRETSLLLDVFTQDFGRISLIARGVRTSKSVLKALLQPFTSLIISWKGKSELMTLTSAEPSGLAFHLKGDCLLSGFYLNEILIRVLQKNDPHPILFETYQQTLAELQSPVLDQKILRYFEKKLLQELGYGLQLEHDIISAKPILADKYYQFLPELGFILCENNTHSTLGMLYSGRSLIALAKEQLDDPECLREIKRLMRIVLAPLLGAQPLHSRKLFK